MRLPERKLEELKSLVDQWQEKRFCTKKELQSLVGKLQHASKVVRSGRTFLRRMFELLKGTAKKQHFIRLNTQFHSDLMWWRVFLRSWNGVSMLASPLLRCFGVFWLWSNVGQSMVPIAMAKEVPTSVDSGKRAPAHCDGMHPLGKGVAKHLSVSAL